MSKSSGTSSPKPRPVKSALTEGDLLEFLRGVQADESVKRPGEYTVKDLSEMMGVSHQSVVCLIYRQIKAGAQITRRRIANGIIYFKLDVKNLSR